MRQRHRKRRCIPVSTRTSGLGSRFLEGGRWRSIHQRSACRCGLVRGLVLIELNGKRWASPSKGELTAVLIVDNLFEFNKYMKITASSYTMQNSSLWSIRSTNATPRIKDYGCKSYQSDTDLTRGVKIFCYCVLMLFSVLGNILLIVIVRRNKRMQTITNYLIVNMAVSDVLITVLAVPRQITEILLGPGRWLFEGLLGSLLCKSLSFFQDISTAVSILSLVVIAIDRHRGVVYPLRKQLINPGKLCKIVIPLIWFTSMGLHAVYLYTFRTVTDDKKTYCKLTWAPKFDDRKSQETYYLILLFFLIIVPTCIITILYSAIILNLKRSRRARCKGPSSFVTLQRSKEDTKVVRIIIAILIAFIVCLIPINVYAILIFFVWDPGKVPCDIDNASFAVHFILYSNASVNPCIYFLLNDRYRKGLLGILRLLHIVKNRDSLDNSSMELVTLVKERQTSSS